MANKGYIGFDSLVKKLSHKGVRNPKAVAASIGRKKYGKAAFQKHAASGTSMKNVKPK